MPKPLFFLPALAFLPSAGSAQGALSCNGDPDLCDRPYNEVAYATTHNAYASSADGFFLPVPNQAFDMPTQLADGVRALMLDTYDFFGGSFLCHGSCLLGSKPLVEGLTEVRQFLAANPNEVVTLILESYLSEAKTAQAFADAGLTPYLYAHPGGAWPTLRTMIEDGTRLVVLTDDSGASLPWHHYVWSLAWETHFDFPTLASFSCTENRGTPPDDLFVLNHFLTGPLGGLPDEAPLVNSYPELFVRAAECWGYEATNPLRQMPNFVTVDHYHEGDVFEAVAALNAAWPEAPLWLDAPPLPSGAGATVTVEGALAGETVFVGYGLSGLGPGACFAPLGGLCLDLQSPAYYLGLAIADGAGVGQLFVAVPPGLPPIEVGLQAVAVRGAGGVESVKSVAVATSIL